MSDRAIWELAAKDALEHGSGYRCLQGNMMARFDYIFPFSCRLSYTREDRCMAMLFMAAIEDEL